MDTKERARGAKEASTSATSRDATNPGHTMSAVTQPSDKMQKTKLNPVSHQPFAVEICCGQASLSRSLLDAGFAVLAVDHVMHDPKAPVTLS